MKLFLNQRGVSPLIATILLVAISLAIAGVLYSFTAQFTATQTSIVTQQASSKIVECSQQTFTVTKCVTSPSAVDTNVFLESTGAQNIKGFTVITRYTDGTTDTSGGPGDANTLSAGSFLTLTVNKNSGKTVDIVKASPVSCPSNAVTTVCPT